ncbi:MAG: hypothetical protein BMS9Abin05_0896 [Rhodothermia bacterium]|nr:MAG: hypothetical protein BMS9Abin05_0896 [Rhodothermia bacterium]
MGTGVIIGMSVVMILIGVLFLYLLLKGKKAGQPKDQLEVIGAALSGLLVISAIALMIMATTSSDSRSVALYERPPVIEDFTLEVPATDFSITGVHDDLEYALSDFRGSVVLVNFWATWCVPCLKEIPDLNKLQEKYRDQGLVIVSISYEEKDLLLEFEKKLPMATTKMRFPDLTDLPSPFTGAFEILPSSFIIDREGTVRRYLLGARSYGFFERAITPFL